MIAPLRRWHLRIFLALALLLPVLLVLALSARTPVPTVDQLPELPSVDRSHTTSTQR